MENNERIARLETIVDHSREDQKDFNKAFAEHLVKEETIFSDIRDGMVQARISIEVIGRTQEKHGEKLQTLESDVKAVDRRVEGVEHKIEDVVAEFKSHKKAFFAYISGAVLVLTAVWTLVGEPIKMWFRSTVGG